MIGQPVYHHDHPSKKIHVNKIENRITFKIKTGYYYLGLLTPETIELLGSTENKIIKDKNGEKVPHLEIAEVVLVYCSIFNNYYQQASRVLYILVPKKPLGVLSEISPTNIFLKTFNSELQVIEVWFRDQNSQSLVIEERINLTRVNK